MGDHKSESKSSTKSLSWLSWVVRVGWEELNIPTISFKTSFFSPPEVAGGSLTLNMIRKWTGSIFFPNAAPEQSGDVCALSGGNWNTQMLSFFSFAVQAAMRYNLRRKRKLLILKNLRLRPSKYPWKWIKDDKSPKTKRKITQFFYNFRA